jgi:ubiquinone/menaquinone biosynthesis C-methylase UbiE
MKITLALALLASSCAARHNPGHHHPARLGHAADDEFAHFVKRMDSPKRAAWQKPDELVAALRLAPGARVADIGAGTGYFTFRLARAVGPSGKVYAVEVDPRMAAILRERREKAGFSQVEVVLTGGGPGLADASVHLAFICDTYHHIGERAAWLRKLKRALRPGGRVVNVDFHDGPLPVGPPPDHKVPEKIVREEFARAGFRLVQEIKILPYQYVLVYEAG